jgi:hypothetical protein
MVEQTPLSYPTKIIRFCFILSKVGVLKAIPSAVIYRLCSLFQRDLELQPSNKIFDDS